MLKSIAYGALLIALALGLPPSAFALELQRLAPTNGDAGAEIHLLGRGFGAHAGDRSVVIQRRGETSRIRMPVLRWSDTDILVVVPDVVTVGIYSITIVGPPTQTPPVQSQSQPFSVPPQINERYRPGHQGDDEARPQVRIRPEALPALRGKISENTLGVRVLPEIGRPDPNKQAPASDVTIRPGFSPADRAPGVAGMAQPTPGLALSPSLTTPTYPPTTTGRTKGCADPALIGMAVQNLARNPDGSYQFQLNIQIRNLGTLPLEVDKKQTRLTVRQGTRTLYSAAWTTPVSPTIRLPPGQALSENIRISHLMVKENSTDLRAAITIINQASGDTHQRDCDTTNNQHTFDSARLHRALNLVR